MRARQESGLSGITYYVRSSVLGGQVVAEVDSSGQRTRSYVYLGGQMLAIQEQSQVLFVHADPVTKSQRLTNSSGQVVSTIELDPFGGEAANAIEATAPSAVIKDIVAGRLGRSAASPQELEAAARWYETVQFSGKVNQTFFRAFNDARAYYLRNGGPLVGTAAEFGRRTGLYPLFIAKSGWGN